jgi:hypothetical protein
LAVDSATSEQFSSEILTHFSGLPRTCLVHVWDIKSCLT